jgi:hypothetical protein
MKFGIVFDFEISRHFSSAACNGMKTCADDIPLKSTMKMHGCLGKNWTMYENAWMSREKLDYV